MTDTKQFYESAEQDWQLIMEAQTDRVIQEICYDGMGFPYTVSQDAVASILVHELIKGVIMKPQGSRKWLKQVEKSFSDYWQLSQDYIKQSQLKNITPRIYPINGN